MVYTYKEVLKKYKTRYNIKKALENNELYKIERGIYCDHKIADPNIVYSLKHPNAIITMDSAFYYYDLTDVIPDKLYLATEKSARPIKMSMKNEKLKQIYVPKEKLNPGKERIEIDGNYVNMYNRERLLVELMRKRKTIPFDYYKELIYSYRDIADDLDMYKINEYLNLYKNRGNIFDAMMREVF